MEFIEGQLQAARPAITHIDDKGEDYWRTRAQALQLQMRRAKSDVAGLEARTASLAVTMESAGIPVNWLIR